MPKLEFHRIEYKKYDTSTIVVAGASLNWKTVRYFRKNGYQKAVVKL